MTRPVLRGLGIAVLVLGYSVLAHYTNQSADRAHLGALVALTPALLIALLLAWRSSHRIAMLALLGGISILLVWQWSSLMQHVGLVYWLQYMSMQLMLFFMFARTLVGERKPLCTHFAEIVHAPLSPAHVVYAQQVTVAWSAFFASIALVSTLLFFFTPLTTWSIFANFMTWPLVVLMFIVEYWVRRWRLPEMRHAHILDAVRAYRNASARTR
ncbi:MAG: COG4648 family protein [Thiobacillus sp.]